MRRSFCYAGKRVRVAVCEPIMTKAEATAEVFLTALKALPKQERDAVLRRIAKDKALARDLLDLATVEQRRREQSRPFREYLIGRSPS